MNDKVQNVLLKSGMNSKLTKLTKLHGDASYREYYRAYLSDGKTRVIMQMPDGKSSVSEEITNYKGKHGELPFINVNKFLSSLKLPVPKVFFYDEQERLMVLEDVGDDMLIKFVKDADEKTRKKWYEKALALLKQMQEKTVNADKSKCVALNRSFDATLLNWEFDHFREWLIEERNGEKMRDADRKLFEEETRKVTDAIIKMPYCFTHRDFQSKNLMVRTDGQLALIDFQDALMGPCVYDLVALLRDSYVELEWRTVEELINIFMSTGRQVFRSASQQTRQIEEMFHLITLQRKMKDAGRFIYIDRVKKNPNFLQYVPTTLRYVEFALNKLSGHADMATCRLADILKNYVPEWK